MEALPLIFIGLGAIILLGLISNRLMKALFLPEPFIIVAFGMLLARFISFSMLYSFAPFLANLALAMILFEAGSNIELKKLFEEITPAVKFAIISYTFTAVLIFLFMKFVIGFSGPKAVLVGLLFGGTSAAAVVPLAQLFGKYKDILELESTITNVFTTIFTLTAAAMIKSAEIAPKEALHSILAAFSIGVFIGLLWGIFWIKVLKKLKEFPFTMTFAALLVLYGLTEYVGGNGGVAALVFGLILGNTADVAKILQIRALKTSELLTFHKELSFFVRTFFFLLTGIAAMENTFDIALLFPAALIVLASFLGRFIATRLLGIDPIVAYVLPKGLAEAVIAFILSNTGVSVAQGLVPLTATVLLLSSALSAALLRREVSKSTEG